jgi:hypothetical protein
MLQLGSDLFELLNAKQWVGNQQPVIYGKGGLSTLDIRLIEAKLGFCMPDDFAFLLQNIRDPGGVLFPWSKFSKQKYNDLIGWVLRGVLFDVEGNDLWLARWGERPKLRDDALDIARRDFATWPKLLPIYGHRFLAAEPCRSGNPVFSIWQTDIVYYGANLAHYLVHEFVDHHARHSYGLEIQSVDIWSDFAEQRPDFLTKRQMSEAETLEIAAGLRRNAQKQIPRPLLDLQLTTDGNILVGGELVSGVPAFEAKLRQLSQQTPPPDLRFPPLSEAETPTILEPYEKTLREFGYTIVLLMQLDGDHVTPIGSVWRLA